MYDIPLMLVLFLTNCVLAVIFFRGAFKVLPKLSSHSDYFVQSTRKKIWYEVGKVITSLLLGFFLSFILSESCPSWLHHILFIIYTFFIIILSGRETSLVLTTSGKFKDAEKITY